MTKEFIDKRRLHKKFSRTLDATKLQYFYFFNFEFVQKYFLFDCHCVSFNSFFFESVQKRFSFHCQNASFNSFT